MMNIITVQDLCLWYGSHQALKDINIDTVSYTHLTLPTIYSV